MAFFVLLLLLTTPAAVVVGQPGFLSIDCGLDDKYSGYTNPSIGIEYVSDSPYIDTGENRDVPELKSQWSRAYATVRTFPSGLRNCYALPTEAGAKYLVRVDAAYGNHDGRNDSSVVFDLHLGPTFWDTYYVDSGNLYETIFVAWASWAPVCLVNTGRGTPFLSLLELRHIPATLYPLVTSIQAFNLYRRQNMGGIRTRFPDDPYDRIWWGTSGPQWGKLSTAQNIQQDPSYAEPINVLQTAVTATGNDTAISYAWATGSRLYSYMVFLHFADFQSAQARQFRIYFNGDRPGLSEKPYSPPYLASSTVYNYGWYRATDNTYNITLTATADSVLPPMCNAIEIYTQLALDGPTTFSKDLDAMMAIKLQYGVKKNWMGDPCFPTKYAWDGVKCSNKTDNTTRITSLDLSNSFLNGAMSKNFTLLTALENLYTILGQQGEAVARRGLGHAACRSLKLDLSNNNLSGSVPDSLPSLPFLRVLNLSGNHLRGDALCKNYTGSLVFRYDSDGYNCEETPKASNNKATVVSISVVVPVLVVVVLLLPYFIWREKRRPIVQPVIAQDPAIDLQVDNAPGNRKISKDHKIISTENRGFTYKELEKFTDNFKRFVGQGGFGHVYYGHLEDGTEFAVKLRSESSSHGLDEFLAEVQSLTKVHHRNLVCLIGYCWENEHLALVYKYMSQGSLCDHLRGKDGAAQTMNWRTRVQVVLEAAQGLDYLHKGCSPPIIHRDVKSSNILLDQNLRAKIADFGLSKTFLSDAQSHISATAAGTAGYMDPEYYQTGRLTEKSDVYSFGVVLLEVATGQPPLVSGHGHIVQRVKEKVATADISPVADPRLGGIYDVSSMWKVVDTAIMCTADSAAQRPTMAAVMTQLKESLALEEAREKLSNDTAR